MNYHKLIAVLILSFSLQAKAQIIFTIAGIAGTYTYSGDGVQATNAGLWGPAGIIVDSSGNIFFADQDNNRVRKINTAGIITTIAGNGFGSPSGGGYSGDGGAATLAEFYEPTCLVFDKQGNLYVSDQLNHCVRKINTNGIISTIAGTGVQGYSGDGGQATAAQFTNTSGLIFDKSGNLYIGDLGNSRVRKVDTAGIITTFAGTGVQGNSGDGGAATLAELNAPTYFVIDILGNFYLSDEANNNIRKINTAGIISTIAGNGNLSYSGDGGQATSAALASPQVITMDTLGNLYVADYLNNRIRKINTSGIITTVVGNGTASYSGDGGLASAAGLNEPFGITFNKQGNLYITDSENSVIRKVSGLENTTGINQFANNNIQVNIYPNPNNGNMFINYKITNDAVMEITDITGNVVGVYNLKSTENKSEIRNDNLCNGIYFVQIKTAEGIVTNKIVIQH
jgi:type IX secretion system substrate protein